MQLVISSIMSTDYAVCNY